MQVIAGDYSPAMLAQARPRAQRQGAHLHLLDAQQLPFDNGVFDVVLLNLILSVVPDGAAAFHEAWRVLKPGGRMGIFDKFLGEEATLTPVRRLLGPVIRRLGTDPNRRLHDLTAGAAGLVEVAQEPSILGGQYQLIWLRKQPPPEQA